MTHSTAARLALFAGLILGPASSARAQQQPAAPPPGPMDPGDPSDPRLAPPPPPEYVAQPGEVPYLVPLPPPKRTQFSLKLYVGPSLRQLYGIGFYGADFGIAIGGDVGSLGIHGVMEGFAGSTTFGLLTGHFRWGVTFEGVFNRFRFGGGPMFGSMWVRRITRTTNIQDLTFGPELHFTVDIVRFDGHALYAGVRGQVDFLFFASGTSGVPVMGELALLLGFRL